MTLQIVDGSRLFFGIGVGDHAGPTLKVRNGPQVVRGGLGDRAPEAYQVAGGRDQRRTIRGKADRDERRLFRERLGFAVFVELPEFDRIVVSARGEYSFVR